jgi:hypothetical protein
MEERAREPRAEGVEEVFSFLGGAFLGGAGVEEGLESGFVRTRRRNWALFILFW